MWSGFVDVWQVERLHKNDNALCDFFSNISNPVTSFDIATGQIYDGSECKDSFCVEQEGISALNSNNEV